MASCPHPFRRPAPRGALLAALALALGLAAPARAADAPAVDHQVKDPQYGQVLFEFFQDQHFTAITDLMVSQHFQRVAHHADEAEVLRGGMLLAYGLHQEAGAIFDRLIEGTATPAVRDRAWYYLAKIRYQRGVPAQAEAALAHIAQPLPGALEEDRQLLKSQVLMALGNYAGAATVLEGMTAAADSGFAFWRRKPVSLYARYNLGVALIRAGNAARGSLLLDDIGKMAAPDEETRSLRDKANVALGFSALQHNQPAQARLYLERVRLVGPHSNKALLGFGWAAASLKNPRGALVPWTELAKRDTSDAAVLEARIAVPYAYAELGAGVQALQLYQAALDTFAAENRHLDESIAAIRAGKLVEGLMDKNPQTNMGWFQNLQELPELPHPSHLTAVLAEHDFQEAFKNYRDLLFLAGNLEGWHEKLSVYNDMLANRRQGFAERLPQVRTRAAGLGIPDLQSRYASLSSALADADAKSDGVAFATTAEQALLGRAERARSILAQHAAESDPELAAARERLRRVQGALTWQLAQEMPGRRWEAAKGLKASEAELAEARRRDADLARAQQDEPARFEQFAARIAELDRRLQALTPRVAALRSQQQQALQALAVAALETEKERLAGYTAQARFAVAQLYDHAPTPKDADHAVKP